MPAYLFIDDILVPYVRAGSSWKKPRTQETEAWVARKLEEFFSGWWVTDRAADFRKVIVGETVAAYRAHRATQGVAPESVKRELAVASAACSYAITELNYDITNPFAGRLMSTRDRKARTVDRSVPTTGEVSASVSRTLHRRQNAYTVLLRKESSHDQEARPARHRAPRRPGGGLDGDPPAQHGRGHGPPAGRLVWPVLRRQQAAALGARGREPAGAGGRADAPRRPDVPAGERRG